MTVFLEHHPPLNEHRVMCTYGLKTDGVQTDERTTGPLQRGVRATPGESAVPRNPATPRMTYDLPYCRGTHRRRAYERIALVCVRAQKRTTFPSSRNRVAGNTWGMVVMGAGERLSPHSLHGYIISQGYSGLLLLVSS